MQFIVCNWLFAANGWRLSYRTKLRMEGVEHSFVGLAMMHETTRTKEELFGQSGHRRRVGPL